jgi:glycosyltransferase involved in cell wall biosynthesis
MTRVSQKKIAIDARMYGKGFGIGRYVESLVHGLESHESDFSFVLYLKPEVIAEYRRAGGGLEVIPAPYQWYTWAEQTRFLALLNKGSHDLVHFPHWNVPLAYRRPSVLTIHDLRMMHFREFEVTQKNKILYWIKDRARRVVVRRGVAHAKQVIAISEFVQVDVSKTFHLPKEKISVVYQSIFSHRKKSVTMKTSVSLLKAPYILYVGAAYPHKNLYRLVDAWKEVCERCPEYTLVLVGKKTPEYEKLEVYCKEKNITGIKMTGLVADEELESWYRHATLLVFPSLYEGCGLPPLEAMSMGVPVVSSSAGALPEVLGEAAYYVDPESVSFIRDGIIRVIENIDLQAELKYRGKVHADMFSRDAFIEGTLEVYRRACREM